MDKKLPGDNCTINRSPLRYIGSKWRLIQKHRLWEFFPVGLGHLKQIRDGKIMINKYSTYIEVFCGSCVMFFNLDPPPLQSIINDIDSDIFNFWNVIKEKYDDFTNELKYTWNGDEWLEKYKQKKDAISRAIVFYIENRKGNFIKGTPVQFYKDFTLWKERMDKAHLRIWNKDYKEVMEIINKPKGKNRGSGNSEMEYVVYQDPPYFGTECVYKNGSFLKEDHEILSKMNHESKHWIFLSYNDCPEVRELYKDWYMLEMDNYYKLTEEIRKELFLSNRPLVRRDTIKNGVQQKVI